MLEEPHILFGPVPVAKLILFVNTVLLFLESPKIPPLFFALVLFTKFTFAIQFSIVVVCASGSDGSAGMVGVFQSGTIEKSSVTGFHIKLNHIRISAIIGKAIGSRVVKVIFSVGFVSISEIKVSILLLCAFPSFISPYVTFSLFCFLPFSYWITLS